VDIRRGGAADVDALAELVERAYEGYIERIGRRPGPMDDDYAVKLRDEEVWVADDGHVVGLLILVARDDNLLIENVAVDPSRQGQGIGRALMAFAEEVARERGLAQMQLYTNEAMVENLALYRRLGYRETSRDEGSGFSRVYLAKRLDQDEATEPSRPHTGHDS
jgi:ribosomal protein S18 acetylase RimI-like enzyme